MRYVQANELKAGDVMLHGNRWVAIAEVVTGTSHVAARFSGGELPNIAEFAIDEERLLRDDH